MENLQPRNLHFHKIARDLIVSHLPKKVHPNLSKFRYGESIMHPLGSIRFSFVMIVHKYHDEITKPGVSCTNRDYLSLETSVSTGLARSVLI